MNRRTNTLLSSLALLACACGDAQAGHDYEGEPLMQLKGSLVTTDGKPLEANVVPAVAWKVGIYKGDYERMIVQDVEVRGQFPSNFEMSVLSPPPEEVLGSKQPIKGFENEPRLHYAYLGALPNKHPKELMLGFEGSPVESRCERDGMGNETCTEKLCDYYQQCFTETTTCGESGCKTIATTGTASVRAGLGVLKGFVKHYLLVYLEQDAQPGSLTAWQLGAKRLSAGYHLVETLADAETDDEADRACRRMAREQGDAAFERVYGIKSGDVDDDDPVSDAVFTYEDDAARALGCKPSGVDGIPVKLVNDSTPITMLLGEQFDAEDF